VETSIKKTVVVAAGPTFVIFINRSTFLEFSRLPAPKNKILGIVGTYLEQNFSQAGCLIAGPTDVNALKDDTRQRDSQVVLNSNSVYPLKQQLSLSGAI